MNTNRLIKELIDHGRLNSVAGATEAIQKANPNPNMS